MELGCNQNDEVFYFVGAICILITVGIPLPQTFCYYSGLETKLSPLFGFAKLSQIQNQLSIKPIAQIVVVAVGGWHSCHSQIFLISLNSFGISFCVLSS